MAAPVASVGALSFPRRRSRVRVPSSASQNPLEMAFFTGANRCADTAGGLVGFSQVQRSRLLLLRGNVGVVLRTSRRKRGGLVSPRAVPRFHRDRRHLSSPGRGRDRSGDDDDNAPYPSHHRGTKTCSAGRDREGGREGDRWLVDSRARSFPGLRGGLDDPQEVHPDPRESLQNMDSLLQVGRIPGFRLLSRRHGVGRGLGPLAQQRERHDPGDLAALANRTRGGRRAPWHRAGRRAWRGRRLAFGRSGRLPCLRPLPPP